MISKKSGTKTYQYYSPKVPPMEISPSDDAFHGSTKRLAAEWWYFDAKFPNNYSFHLACRTYSKKNRGIVTPILNFYKDGKLVAKASGKYLFKKFQTSSVFPLVELSNKTIIEFDQERFNDKGEWVYYISLNLDEHGANLTFIGTSKGFKYETNAESWTVALPKASVTGDITVNGKRMKVSGIGYHDHNWNSSSSRVMNTWGWYWGKIMSKTLNLVWANIMKTSSGGELLAVVNQDKKGFFAINPENIHFKSNTFIRNYGRKMPTSYTIQIDDVVNDIPINADVNMVVKNIHRRNRKILIAPYWRYHVEAKGYISLGSHKETVNSTQIMEFFRLI